MTVVGTGLPAALRRLDQAIEDQAIKDQAIEAHRPAENAIDRSAPWRWRVRRELTAVRDALLAETGATDDGWTAAREDGLRRERNALLTRMGTLGPRVIEQADADLVHLELRRLLVDLNHHAQRLSDLAYDEVELELGGSE